jgi:N-acyl-D-amino-acid deacylase
MASLPRAENFARMGVTTIVTGNCGGSSLRVADFLRGIRETRVSINVATLIGHNTVRREAMGGSFDRTRWRR